MDSPAHQTWLRGDVRVGHRPMLEVLRVLKLEPQRTLIVTLEQGDKEGERQEMVRSKLEKLDVVMRRQRLALFVAKLLPRAAFDLRKVQNDVGSFGFPPRDGATGVFTVAFNQLWVTVESEKELVEEV